MIRFKIKVDTNYLQNSVKKEVGKELKHLLKSTILGHVSGVTPIDTGEAAAGWAIKAGSTAGSLILYNNVRHTAYLNSGSSTQAPVNFIERVVLTYARPLGTIVKYAYDNLI